MQQNAAGEKQKRDVITNLVHIWVTQQEPCYTACGLLDRADTCQSSRLVAERPAVPGIAEAVDCVSNSQAATELLK